ncbi:hypothetical protein M2125_001951 [Polynucleobacter sphagniphilus]|uniref:hypothetical protein n=1 Tax=Polynucleobacter sphagniphilus TaxID=1743169 RepID=UPI002474E1D9|nr:hypothetical protein [Polynucleobacter sphagniphilus]MDH6242131.1 hypothetical protein [Polynucleobacter sphagniphilus]
MSLNLKDPKEVEKNINLDRVVEIVVVALKEVMPYIKLASTTDFMMAYAVMIKTTMINLELSEDQKNQAKAVFDQIWPEVIVDKLMAQSQLSCSIH